MRGTLQEFLRFCGVGAVGFLVDAGMLEIGMRFGMMAGFARLVSIAVALQVTYLLHGAFTFKGHRGHSLRRWAAFNGYNMFGAVLNYASFLAALALLPMHDAFAVRQAALCIGTLVGLLCNYAMNRRFVFDRASP